ncbi:MAG: hypothetical protein IT292_03615 [Deltaproteobacteria bacterium]|nr:hypothetical protein [Deltaproteobacteria bacterium]
MKEQLTYKNKNVFVGIDVHKKSYKVCVVMDEEIIGRARTHVVSVSEQLGRLRPTYTRRLAASPPTIAGTPSLGGSDLPAFSLQILPRVSKRPRHFLTPMALTRDPLNYRICGLMYRIQRSVPLRRSILKACSFIFYYGRRWELDH